MDFANDRDYKWFKSQLERAIGWPEQEKEKEQMLEKVIASFEYDGVPYEVVASGGSHNPFVKRDTRPTSERNRGLKLIGIGIDHEGDFIPCYQQVSPPITKWDEIKVDPEGNRFYRANRPHAEGQLWDVVFKILPFNKAYKLTFKPSEEDVKTIQSFPGVREYLVDWMWIHIDERFDPAATLDALADALVK